MEVAVALRPAGEARSPAPGPCPCRRPGGSRRRACRVRRRRRGRSRAVTRLPTRRPYMSGKQTMIVSISSSATRRLSWSRSILPCICVSASLVTRSRGHEVTRSRGREGRLEGEVPLEHLVTSKPRDQVIRAMSLPRTPSSIRCNCREPAIRARGRCRSSSRLRRVPPGARCCRC